jgi:hypothetical protein
MKIETAGVRCPRGGDTTMDRVARYKELVKQVLQEIAAEVPAEQGIRTEVIFDDARGHYEILQIGWEGDRRVHGSLAHCDIVDGKIHVEHDGTSYGIADFLLKRGVSPEDIVLGFHHPDLRDLTPFAVA